MNQVNVRDLLERPGSARTLRLAEPVEGLTTEIAEVPADEPVRLEVRLESLVEGILVTGPVTCRFEFRCARCLRPSSDRFEVEVTELFRHHPEEEDDYPIGDGAIDLEPMVRDAVLLSMPFSPLCRPECLGLCERCGGDRNLGECSCPPRVDPRWAPLADLDI